MVYLSSNLTGNLFWDDKGLKFNNKKNFWWIQLVHVIPKLWVERSIEDLVNFVSQKKQKCRRKWRILDNILK